MRRTGKDAAIGTSVIVGVAMLGLLPGCGSFRFKFRHADEAKLRASASTEQPTADSDQTPRNTWHETQRQQEVLGAVEAFLKRTEEFGSTDAPAPATRIADVAASGYPSRSAEPPPSPTQPGGLAGRAAQTSPVATSPRASAVANTHITTRVEADDATEQAIPIVESVAIRTASDLESPAAKPPTPNTTNQAISARVDDVGMGVDEFLDQLAAQAGEHGDVEDTWRWRLVQLALRREDQDPAATNNIRADVADLLDAVLAAAREARLVAQDPLTTGQAALASAQTLVEVLASRADPLIPTVALCSEVVTFGVYDTIPEEDFMVGRSLPAIIYIEVDNFTSERIDEDSYRTLLATRLELLTSAGESVWQREEPEIVDRCHRRRRDFFIAQRIALPATLAAGEYVLKVLVEDKLSGKANEAILPITIHAPSPVVVRG